MSRKSLKPTGRRRLNIELSPKKERLSTASSSSLATPRRLREFVDSQVQPDLVAGAGSFDSLGHGSTTNTSEDDGMPRVRALGFVTERHTKPFGL